LVLYHTTTQTKAVYITTVLVQMAAYLLDKHKHTDKLLSIME